MPVRATLQLGDPRLREKSAVVTDFTSGRWDRLTNDLADTLADWQERTGYGRAIAAPQIDEAVRVVYVAAPSPLVLLNPRIVAASEQTWRPWDACLSFSLAFFCQVVRHEWADVEYRGLDGANHHLHAEGELAELLQHEIDHLDGILAVDRMTDSQTLCMRGEFEARYRDGSPYRR
jgi:peptide deformylase